MLLKLKRKILFVILHLLRLNNRYRSRSNQLVLRNRSYQMPYPFIWQLNSMFLQIIICYDVISTMNTWFYIERINWQVFTTEIEHTYYEEDHPFHTFICIRSLNSSKLLVLERSGLSLRFYAFHSSFENLSKFEQIMLTTLVARILRPGFYFC